MEIEKTERMIEIAKQIKELENGLEYDRRKKEYKSARAKIDALNKEAKALIIEQASAYLKKLGYEFVNGIYNRGNASLSIEAYFFTSYEINCYAYIARNNEYKRTVVRLEKSDEEIVSAIEADLAAQQARKSNC